MIKQTTFRKKRKDRTHIIYELIVNGQSYIGITAKTASTIQRSVLSRFYKHYYRSYSENKNWPLYVAMREAGYSNCDVYILEVVRGKADAHTREVELIKELHPILNLASNK